MRHLFAAGITACLLTGSVWFLLPESKSVASAADEKPSGVSVRILDWAGAQQLIAAKKGKIVVVDAWSTSCLPCIKEFPNLVALQKSHKADVACISLNLDYIGLKNKPPESYKDRVLKFLTKQEAAFDNVLCSEEDTVMYDKLGIPSIPAVFVYGRDGKLAKTFDESIEGGFTYKDVTALVDELLRN